MQNYYYSGKVLLYVKGEKLEYKGYHAVISYSESDSIFYGTILGMGDLVDFHCTKPEETAVEFHKAVDDYLDFCAEIGKEPLREAWTEIPNAITLAAIKERNGKIP